MATPSNDDNCAASKRIVQIRQRTVEDIPEADFGDLHDNGPQSMPASNWLERSVGVEKDTD